MVILIVGNGETEKVLQEKFTAEGHRALLSGDAEEITELLLPEEKLDMLVLGRIMPPGEDGSDIASGPDWRRAELLYEKNAAELLCAVQKAFPCLEQGSLKRICYLGAVCGSINACRGTTDYGLHMSACAVNMQINILYNRLRPLGYTFRLFGLREEGDVKEQACAACWYFMENRSVDHENEKHTDENRLVMRDMDGREIPF